MNAKSAGLTIFIAILIIVIISLTAYIIMDKLTSLKCEYDPIDVVYTWSNGSDPNLMESFYEYQQNLYMSEHIEYAHKTRDDLRFSLRSLEKYASWVRNIFILTNGQIPHWLNLEHEKIKLITHDDIFQKKEDLPTFNHLAVDPHIYKIPGLSKRFLYFTDDMFLLRPIYLDDFYLQSRGLLLHRFSEIYECDANCNMAFFNDGVCNEKCNVTACLYDGGDCIDNSTLKRLISRSTEAFSKNSPLFDELFYSYRTLDRAYGFSKIRNVPYYGPLLIDLDIAGQLQGKFEWEFSRTSARKFKTPMDINYRFVYFNFVALETHDVTLDEIFDEFDTDNSGTLSQYELKPKLFDVPFHVTCNGKYKNMTQHCAGILESSHRIPRKGPGFRRYTVPDFTVITKRFVSICESLKSKLLEMYGKKSKYKYDIVDRYSVKDFFYVLFLNNSVSYALQELAGIRKTLPKIICLKDIDVHPNSTVNAVRLHFYNSMFPARSQFELPDKYRNSFRYVDEMRYFYLKRKIVVYSSVVCITYLLLFILYKKLCKLLK